MKELNESVTVRAINFTTAITGIAIVKLGLTVIPLRFVVSFVYLAFNFLLRFVFHKVNAIELESNVILSELSSS